MCHRQGTACLPSAKSSQSRLCFRVGRPSCRQPRSYVWRQHKLSPFAARRCAALVAPLHAIQFAIASINGRLDGSRPFGFVRFLDFHFSLRTADVDPHRSLNCKRLFGDESVLLVADQRSAVFVSQGGVAECSSISATIKVAEGRRDLWHSLRLPLPSKPFRTTCVRLR